MSKYVKQLMTDELKRRWDGVEDALLVDMMQVEANDSVVLRQRLREKDIHVMVVKNSLAARATEGTSLAPAFEGAGGSLAVAWGGEDVVTLAKEIVAIETGDEFANFATRGGVMGGEKLSPEEVKQVSKWPSRTELIATVAGQAIGIGSELASCLTAPAQQLASQIEELIKRKEEAGEE